MKKLVFFHILPLSLAVVFLFAASSKINSFLFPNINTVTENSDFQYIPNFLKDNERFEAQFLQSGNGTENIFLLGSSELTSGGEALPFHFISNHFTTQVKGVGHDGNQCLSIYSQLLANENRLENVPVVIILSPGWFYKKDSRGTSSDLFLEFNSKNFIENILKIDAPNIVPFKQYEAKRIGNFYTEIVNPDINLRRLYFEYQSSKSKFHQRIFYPVIQSNIFCNSLKHRLSNSKNDVPEIENSATRKPAISESVIINWDSLFLVSKQEHLEQATNNSWYINNEYYNQYIKGKTRKIYRVSAEDNQELEDFYMLVKLLRTKNANASFIIIPLNPYYYTNIAALTPLITTLETELKSNQFPCLNLWNADTATFDKGVLTDVMHLSKYGWYQVNKFIVETYHLAQ